MTHVESDHTKARHGTILFTLAVVAVTLVTYVALGRLAGDRTKQETNRADNALAALQQACEQVARLGGQCVTPPSQVSDAPHTLLGPAGEPGPPGPGPTQAQVAAAVAAYLAQHPPRAGPQGKPGPPGSGCPLLGYHFELLTVRLSGADTKARQVLACVPD